MRTRHRFVTVAGAAVAVTIFSPAVAVACSIDNDSPPGQPVDIWFDCGVACGNYFPDVGGGDSVSRPGKAGKVQAAGPYDECETGDRVSLGAHGEAGVTFGWGKKAPNGGYYAGTETLTWVSKGGNPSDFNVTHGTKKKDSFCWTGSP